MVGKDKISNNKKETTRFLLNLVDILVLTIIYILSVYVFYDNDYEYNYGIRGYIVLGLLYVLIIYIFNDGFGSFELGTKKIMDIFLSQGMSIFIGDVSMFLVMSLIEGHILYKRYPYIIIYLVQLLISLIIVYLNTRYIRESFKPLKALVVYGSESYKATVSKLKIYQQYEFEIKKCLSEKEITNKNIYDILKKYESIICVDVSHSKKKIIAKSAYEKNRFVYDVPSITDVLIKASKVSNLIDTPIFKLNKFGPNRVEAILKRAMDLFGSVLLLIIGSPIMMVCAIIIKAQDGGDILFRQKRLTKDGKVFELVKFRSMIMNAEPDNKMIRAKQDDPRITKFGSFMRRTRIDELPQVFNILKGDMSFVGPRALRIEEYKQNEKDFPEFTYRLKVQAGLTGYAQLYGKYNTTFRDKLLFDVYYVENYSLIEDIKLILMSFFNMFSKDSTQGF